VTRFHRAVWRLVERIPRGRVATYGQLAALLGHARAARAVGLAMRRCPGDLPWHRVVNASGGISLRGNVAGMVTQRIRLEQEGIPLRGGRVSLRRFRWAGPGRPGRLGIPALDRPGGHWIGRRRACLEATACGSD
jgi:methylated-DNA-protein-cysteine methyltransferase-like protein